MPTIAARRTDTGTAGAEAPGERPPGRPSGAPATRTRLLDAAELLILTRGWSAFSFQDIADRAGIRKASVHHHFRTKDDLGLAIVDRARNRARDWLPRDGAMDLPPEKRLDNYFRVFERFFSNGERICLGGALGAEINALPKRTRQAFSAFVTQLHGWLTEMCAEGQAAGIFQTDVPPAQQATLIYAATQGSIQIARSTGDRAKLDDAIATVRRFVLVPQHKPQSNEAPNV